MRRLALLAAVCLVFLGLPACQHDDPFTPESPLISGSPSSLPIDAESTARQVVESYGWPLEMADSEVAPVDPFHSSAALEFDREPLGGDIAHYSFVVPVGEGPYEMIRLHRVVREESPGVPIRTRENLFALHGTPGNFEMMFLFGVSAPSVPDELSLALYLARQDVDVWGIDRSVNFVPADAPDLSVMAEWGMQYNIDALRAGMAVARATRVLTGAGPGPLNLLGYSSGVWLGFAALNEEALLPPGHRQIGGFMPVDAEYIPAPGYRRDQVCVEAASMEAQLAAGIYEQPFGSLFNGLSYLATVDPAGASPIVPGFDNRGAALFAGALTWMLYDPPLIPPPTHFFAGVFDANGLPVDLAYTEYQHYLEFLSLAQPYNATAFTRDSAVVGCQAEGVEFADHLGSVTVPVMYVGAAGGIAPTSDYTLALLGSTDVSSLTAQLLPSEQALVDIGHVDLFTAAVSVDLVWAPMLEWIQAHPTNRGYNGHRNEYAGMD